MLNGFHIFILACLEVLILMFYAVYSDFTINQSNILTFYKQFQDVHVMIFVGFGFLMVFLATHSWSSVSFNLFVAAFAIQIVIIYFGFWEQVLCPLGTLCPRINLDILIFLRADFGAAAVLISMGAVLGKVTSFQLIVMSIIELFFYSLNEYIAYKSIGIADAGGSNVIHLFGAVFGLSVSYVFSDKNSATSKNCRDSYLTNLVAMVGTLFLWLYWPSFNSATVLFGPQQERAAINTILAMTSSAIIAFTMSGYMNYGKYKMEDVLNATLAGGVMIGTTCDVIPNIWGAILIGALAGGISCFGFNKINPALIARKMLHDTCGILNLHGIPAFLGCIISAIVIATLEEGDLSAPLSQVFPKMSGMEHRTITRQAGLQIVSMLICMGIAFIAGIVTGAILKAKCFKHPQKLEDMFHDGKFFQGDIEQYQQ